MVNADQAEAVLFGDGGAVAALPAGATVMLCSTVPPDFARGVEGRLKARSLHFLDAPISGGAARARAGTITVMASGSAAAFAGAEPALSAMAEKVYRLGDAAGPASTVR